MAAGGAAGVMAAMITTPLDVAKTRLQTQADLKRTYKGMVDALRSIVQEEGARALLRGMGPRMLYHSASATIAWTTYEQVKWLLGGP
jgi:solute carrier family 25 (mitochondrial iron transporter), member 28/37